MQPLMVLEIQCQIYCWTTLLDVEQVEYVENYPRHMEPELLWNNKS